MSKYTSRFVPRVLYLVYVLTYLLTCLLTNLPVQWEELELTAKTDVYAFGLMLNEMQTGLQPWRDVGNPLTLCRKVVDREERPTPVAPGRLGTLVTRCWAPAAADRPAMDDVRRARRLRRSARRPHV